MRIGRTMDDQIGVVEGDEFVDVTAVLAEISPCTYPLPRYDRLISELERLRPRFEDLARTAPRRRLRDVRLASPVANPGKIVAAPANYRRHLEEARADPGISFGAQVAGIREVGLFLKASSSVIGPSQNILLRNTDRRNDHEIELSVVIGAEADRVRRDDALNCVAGYCVGLDITLRGPEERSLRKSADTYSVLGPWLVTPDELGDPSGLELRLLVNGSPRQAARTADLVLSVPELIEFASSFYTLMPGDVIMTGTPEGVGPIAPGDHIEAAISGIGTMTVHVAAA